MPRSVLPVKSAPLVGAALHQDAADGTAGAADGLSPDMVRLMAEHWRGTNGKSIGAIEKYDMARVYAG